MPNGFSILSVKRNRSTNTNTSKPKSKKAHTASNTSTVSKPKFLDKIKGAFTKSATTNTTTEGNGFSSTKKTTKIRNRHSFTTLLQYFRSGNDEHKRFEVNTGFGRKPRYDSDSHYEYSQYYASKNTEKLPDRHVQTLPLSPTKKVSGILIKRSPTCNLPSLSKNTTQFSASTCFNAGHRYSSERLGRPHREFFNQYSNDHTFVSSTWVSKKSRSSTTSQEQTLMIWDPEFWAPQSTENTVKVKKTRRGRIETSIMKYYSILNDAEILLSQTENQLNTMKTTFTQNDNNLNTPETAPTQNSNSYPNTMDTTMWSLGSTQTHETTMLHLSKIPDFEEEGTNTIKNQSSTKTLNITEPQYWLLPKECKNNNETITLTTEATVSPKSPVKVEEKEEDKWQSLSTIATKSLEFSQEVVKEDIEEEKDTEKSILFNSPVEEEDQDRLQNFSTIALSSLMSFHEEKEEKEGNLSLSFTAEEDVNDSIQDFCATAINSLKFFQEGEEQDIDDTLSLKFSVEEVNKNSLNNFSTTSITAIKFLEESEEKNAIMSPTMIASSPLKFFGEEEEEEEDEDRIRNFSTLAMKSLIFFQEGEENTILLQLLDEEVNQCRTENFSESSIRSLTSFEKVEDQKALHNLKSPRVLEPPILKELRRKSQNCVLKKGRFEITYNL